MFHPFKTVAIVAMSLICMAATGLSSAHAESELERTWNKGLIFSPSGDRFTFGSIESSVTKVAAAFPDKKFPIIVYMHGCSGIDLLSKQTARDYVMNGYIVVMPDSYSREYKPLSCDPVEHKSSLHREVIGWRQEEARNAIHNAKLLPFADPDNIFLVGLSEGAITTATTSGNEPVNARVVEGWTCRSGWPEYAGIAAPESEPVLTITVVDDPWFQKAWVRGDCGPFLSKTNGSKSVVIPASSPLHDQHFVFWDDNIQKMVLAFLEAHKK